MLGRWSAPAVLLTLCAAACGVDDSVVATVGSRHVTQEEFQAFLAEEASLEWQEADARVASTLLDRFVAQLAVISAAKMDDGFADPVERRLQLQDAMHAVCGEPSPPDPEAVAAEVARRMGQQRPKRVLARQILVDDQSAAQEAYARVEGGEAFELVSAEVSRAPNASGGGLIGWVEEHTLVEELDEVLFSLQAGDVSDPVAGPGGYHVFQVMEARDAGAPDPAIVERDVDREFRSRLAGDHFRQCYDRVCGDIGVRIHAGHLWFAYSGRFSEDTHDTT
jgi:parvulin-like peptidyl-prolyl isomerase